MGSYDHRGMTERLKHVLQALAAPAEVQLARYPEVAVKADELALEFDEALRLALSAPQHGLSPEQLSYLMAIDTFLDKLSGGEMRAWAWTEAAVREGAHWAQLREVAAEALRAFGWPIEPPPPNPDVWVRRAAT